MTDGEHAHRFTGDPAWRSPSGGHLGVCACGETREYPPEAEVRGYRASVARSPARSGGKVRPRPGRPLQVVLGPESTETNMRLQRYRPLP